jgi:glycosyltransferase involved in cell wall biosynthesis
MRITVITPSFNQAEYLETTIQSVISQNYVELDYIVIDGGSTDGSVDIIKRYEQHLSFWVSEKDKGQSEALNKGLKKATGDVITWINSDDILLPGALNVIAKAFNDFGPEVGLIYGGATLFDGNGLCREIYHTSAPCPEAYVAGMIFAQPASFFRKCALEEVGLINEDLHYGMDYDLFARLSLVTQFQNVPQMFAKYRLHRSSKTVAEFNRFVEDWKKVFINVCKNLEWQDELDVLKNTGCSEDELTFYSPYQFKNKITINPKLALLHHLYFLQYKHFVCDADNKKDKWFQQTFRSHLSETLLCKKNVSLLRSILSPIYQSLHVDRMQPK